MENAKKNLVFHFGVGHHASFPQKPVVKSFLIPYFHSRHDFESSDANDVDNVSKKVSSTKIDFQEQNEKNKETRLKKAKTAEFLWKQSKPITQSQLGKKYLTEHRKIPGYVLAYLEFKLLRKGTKENNIFQFFI